MKMKGNPILLIVVLNLFGVICVGESRKSSGDISETENEKKVYIVYMGAADSSNASLRNDHAHLLNRVLRRNEKALVRNYKHGFSGFAAHLSKEEANSIAQQPGVVSVFPDPILNLHTTRSWDFLDLQTHVKIDTRSDSSSSSSASSSSSSSDVVIGLLDTGIWPEAASFSDKGMDPIPASWKGSCMNSKDFNSSNCNRKIIGARSYYHESEGDDSTARDIVGHGTHTASTAAGIPVSDASYYGVASGTAKGGSPESRLAIYKVCFKEFGCSGSAILAAFDDAIYDGVDVLSVSLGEHSYDLTTDPVAIGAFHAVERGILVVCSAGNSGPHNRTVLNDAPWIFTVGATTIDRDLQSNVLLGSNKVIKGRAINFSPLSKSADYPLVYGDSAKTSFSDLDEARQCYENSLDETKVKGKIVVCDGIDDYNLAFNKTNTVQKVGGIGIIHITDQDGGDAIYYGDFPSTEVIPKDAATILQYINSTSNPVATILPTVTVLDYKPAPMVAMFSSRGPSYLSKNILKPDIAAPGVGILAAWSGNDTSEVPKGQKPSPFKIVSGTSMSCPHVSGLAASIKARNPSWSISAIRSAIMTSANQINNMNAPITTDSGSVATPYDFGAGEITTSEPFQPGLVYETTTVDYLNYLCYLGFNINTIKVISKTIPNSFSCPKDTTNDHISNINYPSIAISNFNGKGTVNVTRTVTNIGEEDETVYTPIIDAPIGVDIKLIPDKLQFKKSIKKLSFKVVFSSTSTLEEDLFGSITWSNGKHSVRSPFVLAM